MDAVKRKRGYDTLAVWPGTTIEDEEVPEFEKWVKDETGCQVQFLLTFKTLKTPGQPGTGGRSDLVFAVRNSDVSKFAVRRLQYGFRWLDDAVQNQREVYPTHIQKLVDA